MARSTARPLRRPAGGARGATGAQRARTVGAGAIRVLALSTRPRGCTGAGARRYPSELRAGGGARRPHRCAAGDRRVRRGTALRGGRRPRLAPRRGRPATALRAGQRGAPRATAELAGMVAPAPQLRPVGCAARGAPRGRAGTRPHERVERAGVGGRHGRLAGRRPGDRRRHGRRLGAQAARPRPPVEGVAPPGRTRQPLRRPHPRQRHRAGLVADRARPPRSSHAAPGGSWSPRRSSHRSSTGSASAHRSTRCEPRHCTSPTTWPTARASGRASCASARSAPLLPDLTSWPNPPRRQRDAASKRLRTSVE